MSNGSCHPWTTEVCHLEPLDSHWKIQSFHKLGRNCPRAHSPIPAHTHLGGLPSPCPTRLEASGTGFKITGIIQHSHGSHYWESQQQPETWDTEGWVYPWRYIARKQFYSLSGLSTQELAWALSASALNWCSFFNSRMPSCFTKISEHRLEWGWLHQCPVFWELGMTFVPFGALPPFPGRAAEHVGSYFHNQGSNPHPLHWKCKVLTTGQPGKTLEPLRFDDFLLKGPMAVSCNVTSVCPCCCCQVTSVVSDSVWPHRRQPTRLPCPWDSPGKNTRVGSLPTRHDLYRHHSMK